MIELGVLRISSKEGLPFAREKLRGCLIEAGLQRAYASQVVSVISQSIRDNLPLDLTVTLDKVGHEIMLSPCSLAPKCARLRLPRARNEREVEKLKEILAFLTREELMNDLERQVVQRTADLDFERERSDRLLRNMLPDAIAARIKDGQTIADYHDATLVFVDIVGFTAIARERNADLIVLLLDRIFSEFDGITKRHGLEKIKTIGDGYMAAAGLPRAQIDHTERAVLAALDIVGSISGLREELKVPIDVRVGVHTGPVVAGVIGVDKPFYDVWGDTVNVAARLEQHGQIAKVHISDVVRAALGTRFLFEDRGAIEIKNRGKINTWFVDWP